MIPRTTTQWREYWAARSKGTAPGQSPLSVNLVWSLQLRVDHDNSKVPTPTDLDNQPKRSKPHKTCITLHVFDLLRTLSHLVLVTALVPTSMLRNVMCLLDKVAGSHSLPNKRPIGLVEQMAQATRGPQFRILEDTWEEHAMLDKFQSCGCKGTGCDTPVMLVTMKLEYAYNYKKFIATIFQDQSKAFETLRRFLGQEMPLRRLAVPENLIHLIDAFKAGSWFMVSTACGPREADWELIQGRIQAGINISNPRPLSNTDPVDRQIGYYDEHGTTRGSAGRTTTYKAQYECFASAQRRHQVDPAPYIGLRGQEMRSIGHGYIENVAMTVASLNGIK